MAEPLERALGGAQQGDRSLGRVGGALGGGDDHGAGAVVLETAVEEAEGLRHQARRQVVVHGHRSRSHDGPGVPGRVRPRRDGHVAHLLDGGAEPVHVAPQHHGVGDGGAEHPEGHREGDVGFEQARGAPYVGHAAVGRRGPACSRVLGRSGGTGPGTTTGTRRPLRPCRSRRPWRRWRQPRRHHLRPGATTGWRSAVRAAPGRRRRRWRRCGPRRTTPGRPRRRGSSRRRRSPPGWPPPPAGTRWCR